MRNVISYIFLIISIACICCHAVSMRAASLYIQLLETKDPSDDLVNLLKPKIKTVRFFVPGERDIKTGEILRLDRYENREVKIDVTENEEQKIRKKINDKKNEKNKLSLIFA